MSTQDTSHYATPGEFRGYQVIFGGRSSTDIYGKGKTPEEVEAINAKKRTIWVKNRHGKAMCLPVEYAWEYINKAGNKYHFATMEDIPYVPKERIVPRDDNHKPGREIKANTEKTGREVQEMANQGVDPVGNEIPYNELRAIAKENDLKTHGKKKEEIVEMLNEKGLLENRV